MLFPESGIGIGYTVDGHPSLTIFYKVGEVIRSNRGGTWHITAFPQSLPVSWHYKHPDVVRAAVASDRCRCGDCRECYKREEYAHEGREILAEYRRAKDGV